MPGIVGIISQRPSKHYSALVESMVKCLIHEPFYTDGTYVNEELGLWSGWACHQGAFGDCLPVWNEKKDICLLFSGEDFTDQADIDALRMRGHKFGSGDASYLVHLCEEMGCAFLEKLNGWFGGVLVDLRVSPCGGHYCRLLAHLQGVRRLSRETFLCSRGERH